jgi:hypothetical protein
MNDRSSSSTDEIAKMLASLTRDGQQAAERVWLDKRTEFSMHGRRGSGGALWRSIEAGFRRVMRETAEKMSGKLRAYTSGAIGDADQLMDKELQDFIVWMLKTYFSDGADAAFEPELTRLKDDAVRDLRHMSRSATTRTTVHFGDVAGNVNIAAGQGSTANQAIKGASVSDLAKLIRELRVTVDGAPMADAVRLELQDHVEQLEHEMAKPALDKSKLLRAARRIAEFGEKATVAAVGPAVTALIKYLGG